MPTNLNARTGVQNPSEVVVEQSGGDEEETEPSLDPLNLQDELQEFRDRWQRELSNAGQLMNYEISSDGSRTVEQQVGIQSKVQYFIYYYYVCWINK
jgi:hypothetical protein